MWLFGRLLLCLRVYDPLLHLAVRVFEFLNPRCIVLANRSCRISHRLSNTIHVNDAEFLLCSHLADSKGIAEHMSMRLAVAEFCFN